MLNLKEQCEREVEILKNLPLDHPEQVKIKNLLEWSKQQGIEMKKFKLYFKSATQRGCVATEDISEGEVLLFVPKKAILWRTLFDDSALGKKLVEKEVVGKLNLLIQE